MEQKKKHVLFADDDPATRRLFGSKLAHAGFEVLYATDGNEAVQMARRFRPDCIVTDIDMPHTDGIEAAYKLRADSQTKHIPIIFLTNSDLPVEAEHAMKELVGAGYMPKSIDLPEFIEQVKKAIGQ
ncbi:MAG: response regulator [bacterium]|nr:response regulator [bacterium]